LCAPLSTIFRSPSGKSAILATKTSGMAASLTGCFLPP
jgi:hypothetical protein